MHSEWIVVADASAARFISRQRAGRELHRVDALHHQQSRAHEGDLRTGGKGEVADSQGHGVRQADPQTTTGEKHADIFAKQIAEYLKSALNDETFDSLILVAAPSFLGRLRDHMDDSLQARVKQSIDKDWTQRDDREIADLLKKHTAS